MQSTEKIFYKRSKFWVAVAGFVVPIINHVFGLSLPIEQVGLAVGSLASYVVGQGISDAVKSS